MIDIFLSEFTQMSLITSIALMFSFYIIAIIFWPTLMSKLQLKYYQRIQRVHEGEVPRIGGLISVIGIVLYWMICSDDKVTIFIESLLISSIPLLVISLKEDFFHNTRASTRLLVMFLSCFLFFYFFDINFPKIEFPGLGQLVDSSSIISWLFFGFCVVVITNGNNLIDGANGLMSMSILMQIISLLYICFEVQDITNMTRLIYITFPICIFLIFNYPWGKVFMGDLGAYFFGFFISMMTIVIYGDNPELPNWGAVVILFYPAFELLFSVCRKIYQGTHPMQADSEHIHILLFNLFRSEIIRTRVSNGLILPCLGLFWSMPFMFIVWVYKSLILSIMALITMVIIYLGFYWAFTRKK